MGGGAVVGWSRWGGVCAADCRVEEGSAAWGDPDVVCAGTVPGRPACGVGEAERERERAAATDTGAALAQKVSSGGAGSARRGTAPTGAKTVSQPEAAAGEVGPSSGTPNGLHAVGAAPRTRRAARPAESRGDGGNSGSAGDAAAEAAAAAAAMTAATASS